MFTNFSPIRHVNDVEGTYFVKKNNIYLIKNSFVFTSRHSRIKEFMLSAAHFRGTSAPSVNPSIQEGGTSSSYTTQYGNTGCGVFKGGTKN